MVSRKFDSTDLKGTRSILGSPMVAISVIMMILPFLFVSAGPIGTSARAIPSIVINEVLYDPLGSDVSGEFVELYNPTGTSVNMDGWSLTDRDGTGPEIIFAGLSLPTHGYLVIFTGPGANDTDLSDGVGRIYLGRSEGLWSNSGDDVLLLDKTGQPIDYMSYGNGISVDPPPANLTWNGTVPVIPEGYSLGRLPDGNGTADPKYYRPLKPTPGAPNQLDPPPKVEGWNLEPKAPQAFQDLSVWAKVIDDVRLEKVVVHTKGSDGLQQDQNMTWDQGQSRYKSTVKGREGGLTLELWIEATDPLAQSTRSASQNVTFKINASTQLVATVSGPEGSVLPGTAFHIQGHVLWLNGSKVSGNISVEIPDTMGTWRSHFDDYFDVTLIAPTVEGNYDIEVQVSSGEALVKHTLSVDVRWPFKTLQCSLSADRSTGPTILTGQEIFLNGTVTFSDGLAANGASAVLHIIGTDTDLDLKASEQGNLRIKVRTPSIAGTYIFDLEARSMGKNASVSLPLTVLDHLSLNLSKVPKPYDMIGDNLTVAGRVNHHDGTPASNTLVVIEFLGTSHKVRTYTGLDGNFNVNIVAPYYKGQHDLRITAVSGDSVAQKETPLLIDEKKSSSSPTPGWDAAVVLLGLLGAVVLSRKR